MNYNYDKSDGVPEWPILSFLNLAAYYNMHPISSQL